MAAVGRVQSGCNLYLLLELAVLLVLLILLMVSFVVWSADGEFCCLLL